MTTEYAVGCLSVKTGTLAEKAVLMYLCIRANDTGECWPRMETVARELGVSRRTVVRAVKALRYKGLLETVNRGKGLVFNVTSEVTQCHSRCDTGVPYKEQGKNREHTTENTSYSLSSGSGEVVSMHPESKKGTMSEVLKRRVEDRPESIERLIDQFEGHLITPSNASRFWRHAVHLQYPDCVIAGLTGKQMGYLKTLIKEFRGATLERLGAAVAAWPEFAARAARDSGDKAPAKPNLGYLVSHMTELKSFGLEDEDTEFEFRGGKPLYGRD